jgi:hypothetical protein
MAEQRNNIARYYPRAAKLALVRWREVEGVPPVRCKEKAASQWPELPKIHGTTWMHWRKSAEYSELLRLVTGEQGERDRLAELFHAAGGPAALADVADAAAYALAAKAMRIADGAEDAGEVRSLMATVQDARRQVAQQVRQECEERFEAAEKEHEMETAGLHVRIRELEGEVAALKAGGKDVDAAAVAARLNEVLGVRKA